MTRKAFYVAGVLALLIVGVLNFRLAVATRELDSEAAAAMPPDTSYERVEAIRATRTAADTSYERVEAIRAARQSGATDTSYDRVEAIRVLRVEHQSDPWDRVEEIRLHR